MPDMNEVGWLCAGLLIGIMIGAAFVALITVRLIEWLERTP